MAKNGIPTSPVPSTQHIYIQAGKPHYGASGGIFGRSVKSVPAPVQYVIPITAQNTVIHVPRGWSVQIIQYPVMYYPPLAAPQATPPAYQGQYQQTYTPQKPQQTSGEALRNEYNRLWQQDASISQDHVLETLATYLGPSLQEKGFPAKTVSEAKAAIQDIAHDMALKTVRHVEYFINDVDSFEQYNSFLSAHTPEASKVPVPIAEPATAEVDNILPKEPTLAASPVKETEDTDINDEALAELDEITYPYTTIEVPETLRSPAANSTETTPRPSQEQQSHALSHNTEDNPPLPQTTDADFTVKTSKGKLPDQSSATALTSNDKETPVDQPIDKMSAQPPSTGTKPALPPKPEDLAQRAAKATTTAKPPSSQTITAGKQPTTPSQEAEFKSTGTTEKDVQTARTTAQPQKTVTQSSTQRDQTTASVAKSTQEIQTTPVSQREQSTETRPLPETNTQGTQTQSFSRSQGSQTTKPNLTSFSTQTRNDGVTQTADTNTALQSPSVETKTETTNNQASAGTQANFPNLLDNRGSAPVTKVVTASASSARYENIDALQPNNETDSSLKTESPASLQQADQANITKTQPNTRPQVPYKSLGAKLIAALRNFLRLGSKSDTALANSETRSATGPSSIASSDASDIADLASLEGEHDDYTVDDVESQPGSIDTDDTHDIGSDYDDDEDWDDDWDDDLVSHTYENINILGGSENDGNVETAPPSNPYENINRLHRYENIDVLTQPDAGKQSTPTESRQAGSSPAYENLRVLNEPDTARVKLDAETNDATSDYISEDGTADNASQTSSIELHDEPAPPQETAPLYATIDKSRKQPESIASSDSGIDEASPLDLMDDDDIGLSAESTGSGDDVVDIATKKRMLQGWEELSVSWNNYKKLYQALSKGADLKDPKDRLANAKTYAKLASQAKPLNDKLQSVLVALHNDINTHFQDADPETLPAWARHVMHDADNIMNQYRKIETIRNRPKNNPPKVR